MLGRAIKGNWGSCFFIEFFSLVSFTWDGDITWLAGRSGPTFPPPSPLYLSLSLSLCSHNTRECLEGKLNARVGGGGGLMV